MDKVITIEDVVSVFKNTTEKKRLKDIKTAVVSLFTPEDMIINSDAVEIEAQVEALIKQDQKLEMASLLKKGKGFYTKRPMKRIATGSDSPSSIGTDYIGRAGECAVMSELLFRGYNANRMMVDEGVDIIAVKDNLYYYIQVKTTNINAQGRIYVQIKTDKFAQFMNAQIRYIIVARYTEGGVGKNMFFQLTPNIISQGVFQGFVKQGTDSVAIKINFHPLTGQPRLYDGNKEMPIDFYMNNFNL